MPRVVHIETRDPSEIERIWRDVVPTARLDDIDERHPLLRWDALDLGGVTLFDYELGGRVEASADDGEQLIIGRVLHGDVDLWTDQGAVDPTMPYLAPDGLLSARWQHSAAYRMVAIDRSFAQQTARSLIGDDSLVLRPRGTSPLSAETATAWSTATDHARQALLDLAEESRLIEASVREMLVAVALAAFDTTLTGQTTRAPSGAGPTSLRRALRFIDDNADQPITVVDIANAARMSVRGLQGLFEKHLGVSPMKHLRSVRLEGARRDLQAADPTRGATVAAIARRWGFAHLSRFAQYYVETFGEHPSETLRH